jgi:uncharacterized protein (TIGR03067 family)
MNTTLILALTLAAPALKDATTGTIVGEWIAEQITVAGKPVRVTNPVVRWTFAKDGSRAIFRDDEKVLAGKYAFDPKTSAAAVNLDAGPKGGPACLAIYKIEGNMLTLNVGWQKAARPTEFASRDDSQCSLYVFKRIKPND